MTDNFAARAATAAELVKLRSTAASVFTARVNQTEFTYPITELTYDGGAGTYGDIQPGYLLFVGSAAGLKDKGIARIRKSATSTKIYIVSTSAIDFAENDYLTVWSFGRQASKLHLSIQHPATVCTADVQQEFTTLDGIAELTVDNNFGYTDVVIGQTVMVYSSTDVFKGVCRVRKLPTVTKIYINEVSDIQFADNDKIVILDSFSLWQRDIRVLANVPYMDYDIAFGDFRNGGVIPRVGPMVAVVKLVSGTVTFAPPTPTDSAGFDGATVVSYLYDAPNAATTADMDTDHPSWTYEAAGEYRWSCTITDSLGRETVTYRWVFVDPDEIPFALEDCSGDYGEGGWSFTVTCYDDVAKSEIMDRALCVLYADDYYNGVSGSIGKVAGYENILAVGWIDGESITYDSESGDVSFTVRSATQWLSKLRASPIELQDTSGAPANWKQIQQMTVDKALAHVLFWTSTAMLVMDCYLTDDTSRINIFAQPSGSLLEQLNAIAEKIWANVLTNNLGQIYIEIDPQMADTTVRAALPVVMAITTADREDGLNIERVTSGKSSMIELSAASSYDGSNVSLVFSRAPGNIGGIFGSIDSIDDYVVADQSEANRIAGCLLAVANNEYEPLEITMPANNRLFDICPRMWATISIAAGDTERGIVLSTARLIPRKVVFDYDADAGSLGTSITFEVEAVGVDGVTYYPPQVVDENMPDYELGDYDVDFPNGDLGDYFPDYVPSSIGDPGSCSDFGFNVRYASWSRSELRGEASASDRVAKCYFPCRLHANSGGGVKLSKIAYSGATFGDAASNYTLYAFKGGSRVATANASGEFDIVAQMDVDGFEIELDSGLGDDAEYVPLDVIDSGTVAGTDSTGDEITGGLTLGNYYCIEASGGPWYWANFYPWTEWPNYLFSINNNGSVGWDGNWDPPSVPTFKLNTPATCLYSEVVSGLYGRTYFVKSATDLYFQCADFSYADNLGNLGWVLRNARVDGRRIQLSQAIIENVCPSEA